MIPAALLTEFTSDQLETFIDVITDAEFTADKDWAFKKADDLNLLKVQLHNALAVVREQEKIYQS